MGNYSYLKEISKKSDMKELTGELSSYFAEVYNDLVALGHYTAIRSGKRNEQENKTITKLQSLRDYVDKINLSIAKKGIREFPLRLEELAVISINETSEIFRNRSR